MSLNLLVDPVLSERASPFTFLGPRRVNPPGVAFDDKARVRLSGKVDKEWYGAREVEVKHVELLGRDGQGSAGDL